MPCESQSTHQRRAQAMDATSLLMHAHGSALRLVSSAAGIHFSGLQAASRHKSLPLSNKQRRLLGQLDTAFNWARHVTQPRVDAFLQELSTALDGVATLQPHDHVDIQSHGKVTLDDNVSVSGNDTLTASFLLMVQEEKMMESQRQCAALEAKLSSQISSLEDQLALATKLPSTGSKEYGPLPTLVAMRGNSTTSYPGGASSSQPPVVWAEMRFDTAGDGGLYTEQEFRDYYRDNFTMM